MKYLIFLLILTGCTPAAELDNRKCLNYGFTAGSTDYANCRMALEDRRDRDFQESMAASGAFLKQQNQYLESTRPRITDCTGYGSSVTCRQY